MKRQTKHNREKVTNSKTRKNTVSCNYVVAIPTYKRYNEVYEKSIKTLLDGGVSHKKIHIFVANNDEYKKYSEILPLGSYYKIIIGKLGITNQRRFMVKYFLEGSNVLFLDDDVEKIEKLNKTGTKLIEMKRGTDELHRFICDAFIECKKKNIFLWGIYPVRNPFFMKPRPIKTYDLRFILGTFYGTIIRHSKDLKPSVEEKEDVENSILHYKKDGKLLRFEKVTLKTKFFNPKGGIGSFNERLKTHEISAKTLLKKYPEYGRIQLRKNGMYEFVLREKKKE